MGKQLRSALFLCLLPAIVGAESSAAGSRQASGARPGQVNQTPQERPDQKIDRLTAAINSKSLSGETLRQALRERAFLNATTGRLGFAHLDVDALLAMDPRDPDAHFARGLALFVGNPLKAVQSFSQVTELEPGRVDGYRGRAWANLVAGEYAAATKDFDRMLQLEPDDPEAYRGRAWAAVHSGSHDRAILDFTEVLRRSPGNPEASAGRGLAYYLAARFQDARADWRSTMRYGRPRPSTALVYNQLGFDDWRRDRRIGLLLEERTQSNPNDINAWLALGVLGDSPPAFDRAVKLAPGDIDALMLRAIFQASPVEGSTVVRAYNRPAALADLTEVIRLKPDHGEAYYWRALLLAMDKEALNSAIADCEKALALSPGDPTLSAVLQKLTIDRRAWDQAKTQAAIAQAQFEKDKEAYAVAFLIGLVAIFGSSPQPPDPYQRSYLDDLRLRRHFFRPCITSVGTRC